MGFDSSVIIYQPGGSRLKDTLREGGFFSSSLLFVYAIILLFQILVIKYGNPLLDDSAGTIFCTPYRLLF